VDYWYESMTKHHLSPQILIFTIPPADKTINVCFHRWRERYLNHDTILVNPRQMGQDLGTTEVAVFMIRELE